VKQSIEPKECELSSVDLPKTLLSRLQRADQLHTYMREVCGKTPPSYIRLSVETKSELVEWTKKHLSISPNPLLWRGYPVIAENESPPPATAALRLSANA
jgi:hypothetical protein